MNENFQGELSFQWDTGNSGKNFQKHQVSNDECEQVFVDPDKIMVPDPKHSGREKRFIIIGKSKIGRALCIVFTIRYSQIRVISARDLNRKEKIRYL
ncbi:MAG: hypothetical protein A3C85_03710 [Candidatus Doudnabacteria bacterium RIFCSPHIGHO2_02_FULL_48_21]|uniref:Toxin n=1 Tax=Candidatus Doudnabacteria bacterium RIFCSPLOWO2_02_FULL_48_13 TaxID=1817845 RepID=A0A1F5QBY0_9BACT|nr:MAG: hypothetical protein A3K05_03205 [Candidatus Doudnabacteria bacterium RIFCSPHIGHO2_01_48_18]OGE79615.1 MAG: hypothetical protein A2668_01325 [Candidatus Doudnabacteria bacterium RIFCSPHIGHO2_01_FULL_48_180]OGE91750.1 MAG: hypothetical protein A3F44_00050 [Candidatus Doudnabacteria bacterium RIFCSPHIGHO2_12_FULL_47_25]OGE93563.1 MAG: hypothetical protein A3C85_03710 [Candidatus Doudnabacteria bacterium RIFCSPHIGHO2_02_FULL_48_21]OGE96328.1 MAG: hypothetical protein A3A83_00165 [Candidatu